MLALVDIVTFIVLFTFLRFSLVAPGYSFSIFRGGILCRSSPQINFDFQSQRGLSLPVRRFTSSSRQIGFVTETIGLARSAIISVPVSIGFGLKKHFSVAKRIVFAGEKTFVVVQKIRFVTEMI